MAGLYSEMPGSGTFEGPLSDLESLYARKRGLQTQLTLVESQIEHAEAHVCRALRAARRKGSAGVVLGETAYFEASGQLHAEHWPQAATTPFDPESADGKPWTLDDRVGLGPTPATVETRPGTWHGADRAADGPVVGERPVIEQEDRSC